ncbi:MAG: hypothetical protein ACE5GW_08890 [Planctomycetota bacterium]
MEGTTNGAAPAAQERSHWKSRIGFILAASGSAVGLGNIWKFPYITGENGGGLFVLIYLFCIVLVGMPIMAAEIMIGRAARKQPVGAFAVLQGGTTAWSGVGWLGVITGFIILSYYIVVAGWSMDYALKSVCNFMEPIHDKADVEATAYRVTTPLSEVKELLVGGRVETKARATVADIRREAPKKVWKGYERFQAAAARAGSSEAAEAVLFSDRILKDQVEEARALEERIAAAREEAKEEALSHYADVPEEDLRREPSAASPRTAGPPPSGRSSSCSRPSSSSPEGSHRESSAPAAC